jgi:glycosyl hydrolase family 42 (putative beta-galactosidase)
MPDTLTCRAEPFGEAVLERDSDAETLVRAPEGTVGCGVTLRLEVESRDWRRGAALAFELWSATPQRLAVTIRHGGGEWRFYLVPMPGVRNRVVLRVADLQERPRNTSWPGYFTFGGGPAPVDLAEVSELEWLWEQPGPAKELRLGPLDLLAAVEAPSILDPVPRVDTFGQWIGLGGEPASEAEIRTAWAAEPTAADHPPGQTANGGDPEGRLAGTGFFRLAREEDRWWLVDPDGYRFFSMGCCCVRPGEETPIDGREALFADPPAALTRSFWGHERWLNFYQANLERRDGDAWLGGWCERTLARLRRWGFNTIANWSDPRLTSAGLMPYTTNLASLAGMCARLPDVYAPGFEAEVQRRVEPELWPHAEDRVLIGYFVGNEPVWTFTGHRSPFGELFTSPEYPHTRAAVLEWLRARYHDQLADLNAAWDTAFAAWDDLQRGIPDPRVGSPSLREDAAEFMGLALGRFYDTACRAIRSIDPHHLLLGGRFYSVAMPEPFVRACRSFDVYSFNCYQHEVPLEQVERVERLSGLPSMVGEFHFGEIARGMSGALISVRSQRERGLAYRHYVEHAARHPALVGLHWFQWVDEPVTGRFDGENYNIGLVDVTDRPYDEMLSEVRAAHERLYALRRSREAPPG